MVFRSPTSHDAISRYRQAADKRPSAQDLRNMIASIEDTGEPSKLCTLASMCIDLAIAAPGDSAMAIDMARDALEDAVSGVSWYVTQQDSERTRRRISEPAVTAQLMLAELDNWGLVANGQTPSDGYESLLGHMVIASMHTQSEPARARLAEAVPLLLGLRRKAYTHGELGWHGRMALPREDWRSGGSSAPGENKSWDTGAATSNECSSFLRPEIQIQVKLGTAYYAKRYLRAGVVPLSARTYGFDDPGLVTISCAQEYEGFSLSHLLTTRELDRMTVNITKADGMNNRLAA